MSKYKELAIHSLKIEIKGLESVLNNSINNIFDQVVETILNVKGKVIFSAVGKPSYIARRVSATLSSVGIPSFFVHADEASHGDMGMIQKDDVVIILSNSGETKELKDVISYCQQFNITIIGLTRTKNSFLDKSANISVVLENIEQTNSVNSPTTSEIMFLSYLDAVTTVLINITNFGKEEFKIFHPGGKIGFNLLKVQDLMHKIEELPIVLQRTYMCDAIKIMIQKPLGCLLVVNSNNTLLGILTDGDFKRKLLNNNNLLNQYIDDIITTNIITVDQNLYIKDAINIMTNGKNNNYIQVLPVVDNNKLVGLLHIQDCLKYGIV